MKNRTTRNYANYIDGNAVRKVQGVPERHKELREKHLEIEKKNSRKKAAQRNLQRELKMSFSYVVFLVMASVIMVSVCVQYLRVQTSIISRQEEIVEVKSELNTLISQNDAIEYNVDSYIDVENIIKIATRELGMIKAGEEQISLYERSESEYMKQIEDIPVK